MVSQKHLKALCMLEAVSSCRPQASSIEHIGSCKLSQHMVIHRAMLLVLVCAPPDVLENTATEDVLSVKVETNAVFSDKGSLWPR